jgi:1,4-dihydroxy-2-naphthoate octaprenyltransferase
MSATTLIQSSRPPFLVLTLSCALLAVAMAKSQGPVDWPLLSLALIASLLAHISVNVLNEYQDFRSGLDLQTRRTPFSGGSGALPADPHAANSVLYLALIALAATAIIGLNIVIITGVEVLPLGLLGLFLVAAYTPWINQNPWLCLLAPGLGFGLIMVPGVQWVASGGEYASGIWLVALVPCLLTNNLLLINQFPDIEADRAHGRNHFPIAFGVEASVQIYGLSLLTAMVVLVAAVALHYLPQLCLITLIPMALSIKTFSAARALGADISQNPQAMVANVLTANMAPLVLGVSLWLAW